ncbi:polysaccharide deacetylase family protein [Caloramator sp. CAR-1]|uniref:polysaccharide deacetylase family protein n=1 Tax=Caloramator sp. CAR-1 TaxID=3062777 RepID=UPI0026E3D6FC|nr:polysaccharide deacetylase family protein [Caloramator sp. CAR-1]MDO6355577.1 polysaccharide deacetylase family protein [Caloramator sp. CAR-1]
MKRLWLLVLFFFLFNFRVDAKFEKKIYYKDKIAVLTYHNVSPTPLTNLTITPKRFEDDLLTLKRMGFNFVSLKDTIDCLEGRKRPPVNAVLITFDDGLKGFYRYAFPILRKYNIPSVNFIVTSRINTKGQKDSFSMNEEEVKDAYSSGFIEIESHTHESHDYIYVNESLKQGGKLAHRGYDPISKRLEREGDYEKRIYEDLVKSREVIKNLLGRDSKVLCFPFGQYNEKVLEIAKGAGFEYFVTTERGLNKFNSKSKKIYRYPAGYVNIKIEDVIKEIIEKKK